MTDAETIYNLISEVYVLLNDAERHTLKQHNLSLRQFYALQHLGRKDGLSINDLSERLLCDKSSATRIVEQLKQSGLVTRQQHAKDRRFVSVKLTDEGCHLQQQTSKTHQHFIEKHLVNFSPAEQESLTSLLTHLRNNLQSYLKASQNNNHSKN